MLSALVQSGISSFPNRAVSLQFFEAVSRYIDFFKIRKEYVIPTLEAMVDARYVLALFCVRNVTQYYRT